MREKLVAYLEENNLSLSAFARLIVGSPSAVFSWTKGISIPHPKTALKIEKVTKGKIPISSWGYVRSRGNVRIMRKKQAPRD